MEERLKHVLENVNEWLRFAENKNAALVAFNSAVGFGVVAIRNETEGLPKWAGSYLIVVALLLLLGIIASLLSFLPQLRLPWFFARSRIDARDSLLYFGHIARFTPDTYIDAFAQATNKRTKERAPIEKLYAEQIVMNSQIALYKYRWFLVAFWLTLAAFATPVAPVIGLVIWLVKRKESR